MSRYKAKEKFPNFRSNIFHTRVDFSGNLRNRRVFRHVLQKKCSISEVNEKFPIFDCKSIFYLRNYRAVLFAEAFCKK